MTPSEPGNESCPCGKGKSLALCCGQFLNGQKIPRTPEQLMRSRYTAYALGGYGQYLLDTWFPVTAQGLNAAELSLVAVNWQRLEVIGKSQSGDEGHVEFKAYFTEGVDETVQVMHEHSEFRRIAGRWYYVGARMV